MNVVATETKFGVLPQCPTAANDASPGLVSWWHCGLDTWLDLFLLWVRIVNAHKSKLFHICIHWLRIWCKYLIMVLKRDWVEVCDSWLCPSLSPQTAASTLRQTHSFLLRIHICHTDTGCASLLPNSSAHHFVFCLNNWVLAVTPGLKWLHVNCVSRADFQSKERGQRTWHEQATG